MKSVQFLWPYFIAFISIVLSSTGQVLFKLAVRHHPISMGLLSEPTLYAGLVAYGLSAGLWLIVLSRLPLVVAYPLVSLNFVLIGIAGQWILHEKAGWNTFVGTLLVMIGIVIVGMKQRA